MPGTLSLPFLLLIAGLLVATPQMDRAELYPVARNRSEPSSLSVNLFLTQDGDDWAAPVNLSRSGSTTAPQLIIDSVGRQHVLWEDSIAGFVYAVGGPDGWSEPRVVELPFFTRRYFPDLPPQTSTPLFKPTLLADTNGNIHAFWVDTVTESAGTLRYSRVPAGSFAQFDAWSAPEALESSGISPAASANASGVHLAYVRQFDTADRPAGVYYRRFSTGSQTWGESRPLYTSRYLRGVTEETANVSISASDSNQLYVVWDDPAREQVFVAASGDGGATWEAPFEVDRRAPGDTPTVLGPGEISVGNLSNSPVIIWRAGHQSGSECTQYYRSRPADTTSWTSPQAIPGIEDCLASAQFIRDDGLLYLVGTIQQSGNSGAPSAMSTYIMAWDGMRWSTPRLQDALVGMTNPDTNQRIDLQCLSAGTVGDRLSIAGCDRGTGADIWWTSKPLGDTATWFPPPAVWEGPVAVAAASAPIAEVGLTTDGGGGTHAFWFEQGGDQIFHAARNETGWSQGRAIVTSDAGQIEEFAVTSDGLRLYLAFRADSDLYFARADAGRPAEWSTPVAVTNDMDDIDDVTLLSRRSGELMIAYTVALNEPRGVYLIRSANQGLSWSSPSQAFNGAAAGWPAVGQVYLTETGDGQLHGLWTQRDLPPGNATLGLGYSRSSDGGATWSPVNPAVDAPALWAALQGYGASVVHQLWAEPANGRLLIRHSLSADSGITWSEGAQVGSLDGADNPAMAIDSAGQLHVVGNDGGALQSWTYNGLGWDIADPLATNLADGGQMTAIVDVTGRLVSTYAMEIPGAGATKTTGGLFSIVRPLDLPASVLPTPVPPPATATPAATVAPVATLQPTPTIVVPTAPDDGLLSALPGAGSRTGQMAIAIIPAVLIVLIAVIIGLRAIRRGGR